jgi:hypothetical protein
VQFLAIEEVDMVEVVLRSQKHPLSFLEGHFQDIEDKLNFQNSWG